MVYLNKKNEVDSIFLTKSNPSRDVWFSHLWGINRPSTVRELELATYQGFYSEIRITKLVNSTISEMVHQGIEEVDISLSLKNIPLVFSSSHYRKFKEEDKKNKDAALGRLVCILNQ